MQRFNLIPQFIYHQLATAAPGFLWAETPKSSSHAPMAQHLISHPTNQSLNVRLECQDGSLSLFLLLRKLLYQ